MGVDEEAVITTADNSLVLVDETRYEVENSLLKRSGKRKEDGISAKQADVIFRGAT